MAKQVFSALQKAIRVGGNLIRERGRLTFQRRGAMAQKALLQGIARWYSLVDGSWSIPHLPELTGQIDAIGETVP